MKPWELLGEAEAPDGTEMKLMRRDREYVIFSHGRILMSSRMHGSEAALAALACERARTAEAPCVLVGGLGLGFTLRATLDLLPHDATVVVAELVQAVVDWNQGPLGPLAANPLRDRRVQLEVRDVGDVLAANRARFDAILLDVDNGPEAFVSSGNVGLYGDQGLARARAALKPGGTLAVWSAFDDRKFVRRLRYAGFSVNVEHVRARLKQGGPMHTIFVARREEAPA
jgi:spermidine synthase